MLPRLVALVVACFALLAACSDGDGDDGSPPTPTATAIRPDVTPTSTPIQEPTATPTEEPTPTATPRPDVGENQMMVIGDAINVREQPTTQSATLRTLEEGTIVDIKGSVRGENWIVGTQNWGIAYQAWHDEWFELDDGGFVYSAFLFKPNSGEALVWELPEGERWVEVNTSTQQLFAYVGDTPVFVAAVTTGKPGFESPAGSHRVFEDGRILSALMTSEQAGYGPEEQYRVERVLFTQYFTGAGDALHLNYWRPVEVFGGVPTSHGCIGLWLHDAQWLWLFGADQLLRVEIHA